MTVRDQEHQDAGIKLMTTQEKLADRQFRLEIAKVLTAFLAAVAVFAGVIQGIIHFMPSQQPTQFPPGTVITIPAPKP